MKNQNHFFKIEIKRIIKIIIPIKHLICLQFIVKFEKKSIT